MTKSEVELALGASIKKRGSNETRPDGVGWTRPEDEFYGGIQAWVRFSEKGKVIQISFELSPASLKLLLPDSDSEHNVVLLTRGTKPDQMKRLVQGFPSCEEFVPCRFEGATFIFDNAGLEEVILTSLA